MVHGKKGSQRDLDSMLLCRSGRLDAFTAIVRRHQKPLLNFFLRMGIDPHGAEDCAQETFLRLFRSRSRYRPSASFAAFLYTLARHSWADWSRRERRRKREKSGGLERLTAEDPTSLADDRLDLQGAISALPEHLRIVVVLGVSQGLGHREVAAVLKIPEGTVKSRMFHAIRRLREALHVKTAP